MAVSFQTNALKSRREAVIDGHKFIVRRFGNIERMEIMRLNDEIAEVLKKYPKDVLDKDISPSDMKIIQDNARISSEKLVDLFDDGTETQEISRKLVSSLEDDDILEIIASIFEQTETKDEQKPQ